MTDNSKTTLGLPVKTTLAANTDRLLFIWNATAGDLNAAVANTASITATKFLQYMGIGKPRHALVNGAAAGNVVVTNIVVGDRIDEVIEYVYDTDGFNTGIFDLTTEFSIAANGMINNANGNSTANNKLLVRWTKLT